MFTEFCGDYYGLDPLTVGNFVYINTYKGEYPIFHFDVVKQSELLNQGNTIVCTSLCFDYQ